MSVTGLDLMGGRMLAPGWIPREPGLETYWVRPGGITCLKIHAGDEVTVIDVEGRQRAEIMTLPVLPGDRAGTTAFGLEADAPATTLAHLARLYEGRWRGDGVGRVIDAVAERGIDPSQARCALLFGAWNPAGSRETFRAEADLLLVLAAPDRPLWVDADDLDPGTPIQVEVRRAAGGPDLEERLPAPLAEPVLDLRIDAATAMDYEVKAGQYIQVIDVRGRQCSDFLAFDARRLADGLERGLDATVTRSYMANAYPQPGLHGKFYNQEGQPLVEVVQDLVGRHDTFALACNSKYYEDAGYPGHVNCTDNFNARLARYGISPRRGWPALNFFYNTGFDDHNQFIFDEPWSRPGDYVLMQAKQDLVCASSACPDDIDPSNAWICTDIHVRVYDSTIRPAKAVHHRITPERDPVLTKQTGFHERTSALTKQMHEYRGYWLPTSYDDVGAIAEYWACRERVAMMDLSPLRKFEVLGPDAEELLQTAMTRNIRKLSHGQVVYTAMCNETGGMIDDGTVFRLGDDRFRFIGGDDYAGEWLRELARRRGLDRVWVKSSTDVLHNIAVQGPASRDLLSTLFWSADHQQEVKDIGWFRFTLGRLHDHQGVPVMVSRTGYSGELGYEVFVHPSQATEVWDAIWEAGQSFGIAPLGLDALDMLRIESGLVFAGYDFDDQTDPFEAGIGFTVPLKTKEDDFVGREALLERKAHPQRTLVGLELAGNETAQHGDCVRVGRSQVGVITSATRSPLLRKNIALCRMAVQFAEPGTEVEVGKLDGHAKRIPATVVPFPFYDPKKERPRS